MPFVPHYRVTMLGKLGNAGTGPEMFSMNFGLARTTGDGPLAAILDPNATVWDDLADDCADFFADVSLAISAEAKLTMVKIAPVGANGRYTGPAVERLVNTSGPNQGVPPPFQVALAVTLKTDGDLGRVKGRFYVPVPVLPIQTDGRITSVAAEAAEAAAQTFLNNVNNQPGIDVLGLGVVVASQGRHNKDGSVRLAPANHQVTGVSVGRTLDTIRRRRNKLPESHTYRAVTA